MSVILILLVVLVLAGAGYFWYKNKDKKKTDEGGGGSGDVYRANIPDDCTGVPSEQQGGGIMEIRVHSTDQASITATNIQKGGLGSAMSGPNPSSDLQTGMFMKTGCMNITTNGDVITYDVANSHAAKWFGGGGGMPPKMVFTRKGDDTVVMNDPSSGAVCSFKKVAGEKAGECEKPEFGCKMM